MAKTSLFKTIQRSIRKSQLADSNLPIQNSCASNLGNKRIIPTAEGRRDFIKLMGAGVAANAMAPFYQSGKTAGNTLNQIQKMSDDPIIILGGGIAGLTAAYRLAEAGIECEIFESSSRLGGRIFTQSNFNDEGMFCELGGELIDSDHRDLLGLAGELNVEVDDFKTIDQDIENFHFFFNGKHYFEAEVLEAFKPLADRLTADMNKTFTDPNTKECNYRNHTDFAVQLDQLSLEEYLYSIPNVEKWVLDLVNVAYTGEYGADTCDQSAINLLSLVGTEFSDGFSLYSTSDESKRIKGGNSRLIEALAKSISGKVKIHLGSTLVKLEDKGSQVLMTFDTLSGVQEILGAKVICTIPFTTLRFVEGLKALGLSPVKLKCIQEIGCGLNTKYMLGFKNKLWRDPKGPVIPSNGYCYSDLESQTFWETSRMQNGKSGIITNFIGGKAALQSSPSRLQSTLNDLNTIYPGISRDFDGKTSLFQWGSYQHSKGSYACPKPGQYTTIVGSPGEAELENKLLFAGEHVSELYQGYMNGAVQSANQAAEQIKSTVRPHLIKRLVYGY